MTDIPLFSGARAPQRCVDPLPLYCISRRRSGEAPLLGSRIVSPTPEADGDRPPHQAPAPESLAGAPPGSVPSGGTPSRAARAGRAIRGLAVDITPLRSSSDFRLLRTAGLLSQTGRQFTLTAV